MMYGFIEDAVITHLSLYHVCLQLSRVFMHINQSYAPLCMTPPSIMIG